MVLVSIVIPTYNEEKHIRFLLESIKKQDYDGEIEIIVADAYSQDKTVEIAKQYTDKIVLVKERGIARGRNAGLKIARGEIVIFVDADTLMFPNCVSTIVNIMKSDKDIVGVCPVMWGYEGNTIHKIVSQFVNMLMVIFAKFGKYAFHTLCVAYRRKELLEIGGFNEDIEPGEDIDISLRICKLGKCIVYKKPLAATSLRRLKKFGVTGFLSMSLPAYVEVFLSNKQKGIYRYPHVTEGGSYKQAHLARAVRDTFSIIKNLRFMLNSGKLKSIQVLSSDSKEKQLD